MSRLSIAIFALPLLLAAEASANPVNESWKAQALKDAQVKHAQSMPETCREFLAKNPGHEGPVRSYDLPIGEDTAARQALLVQFLCRRGAYNETYVFILADQYGTASEVIFPSPKLTQPAAGGDVTIEAMIDSREVVNASYDVPSRTMSEHDKWRSAGDAATISRWGFRDGRFQMSYFALDETFDGQQNKRVLIERDIW